MLLLHIFQATDFGKHHLASKAVSEFGDNDRRLPHEIGLEYADRSMCLIVQVLQSKYQYGFDLLLYPKVRKRNNTSKF